MFTRLQLIVDTANSDLVYRTTDFRRRWTIGSRPIQRSPPRSIC